MLRYLESKKAQAISGEYAIVLFLGVAVAVAMTVFFKRTVQGRIHDARDYMIGEVRTRTAGVFNGNLYKEYEPYYGNTRADVVRTAQDKSRLSPGATSGIFQKDINQMIDVRSSSVTLPPRDFNLTTPKN